MFTLAKLQNLAPPRHWTFMATYSATPRSSLWSKTALTRRIVEESVPGLGPPSSKKGMFLFIS